MCNIAERLLEERKRLDLNQQEMADLGKVAKRTYCNYEAGEREPMGGFFTAIATAGADVQYILTGARANMEDVDIKRLTLAIESVEEGLQKTNRTMKPDKKAQLIVAVYDLFAEPSPVMQQSILKLVQSAA